MATFCPPDGNEAPESPAKLAVGENVDNKADECGQNVANRRLCDVPTGEVPLQQDDVYRGRYTMIKSLWQKLRRVQHFAYVKDDNTITKAPGATVGNKCYAYLRNLKLAPVVEKLAGQEKRALFITLTKPYEKTAAGRLASWQRVHDELPKAIRKLKSAGMVDFCWVKEAHYDGGCHVHMVAVWNKEIKTRRIKGKLRVISRLVVAAIKAAWEGFVDIQGVSDEGARGYLTKELGKFGHIEDALRRAKRKWSNEGDKDFYNGDWKRIQTYYYASKLKLRLYGMSRGLSSGEERTPETEAADLIIKMNNTTAESKAATIAVIKIPREIVNDPAFEPLAGLVDPATREYKLLWDYYLQTRADRPPLGGRL